jgi:hypothetical protein
VQALLLIREHQAAYDALVETLSKGWCCFFPFKVTGFNPYIEMKVVRLETASKQLKQTFLQNYLRSKGNDFHSIS